MIALLWLCWKEFWFCLFFFVIRNKFTHDHFFELEKYFFFISDHYSGQKRKWREREREKKFGAIALFCLPNKIYCQINMDKQ